MATQVRVWWYHQQQWMVVDIITKRELQLLTDMLRKCLCWEKKVSDDTKRSFFGGKCCRNPDLLKKQQGVMILTSTPEILLQLDVCIALFFHSCLRIQYTSLWWLSFSLQIPWDCSQKRNFLQTPFWVRLCSYAFKTFSHSFPMWGEGSFPYSFPLIPFMPIKFFPLFSFFPNKFEAKFASMEHKRRGKVFGSFL